jgi:carbon storage regulator CsrA
MLILTRKENESIQIELPNGHFITLFISKLKRKHVRIAIEAAPEIKIIRAELLESHLRLP